MALTIIEAAAETKLTTIAAAKAELQVTSKMSRILDKLLA